MNGLVMYDRETSSLWSQVIGQAVDGQLKGAELTVLPAMQTTWSRWIADHPETRVLDKGGGYSSDTYDSYYRSSSLGIRGQSRRDDRLYPKEFVVGVTIEGQAKAYPFGQLDRTPVVNDVVNGVPLVITFDSDEATGMVFNPMLDGRRLNFREVSTMGEFLMEDLETGTVWDPLNGVARRGPLVGKALERVASHYEFWFAWKDYRPDTDLYLGAQLGASG